MNSDLSNLVKIDLVISLILEFLFGSVIELNGNIEALGFRLICKKFKQIFDSGITLWHTNDIYNYDVANNKR